MQCNQLQIQELKDAQSKCQIQIPMRLRETTSKLAVKQPSCDTIAVRHPGLAVETAKMWSLCKRKSSRQITIKFHYGDWGNCQAKLIKSKDNDGWWNYCGKMPIFWKHSKQNAENSVCSLGMSWAQTQSNMPRPWRLIDSKMPMKLRSTVLLPWRWRSLTAARQIRHCSWKNTLQTALQSTTTALKKSTSQCTPLARD